MKRIMRAQQIRIITVTIAATFIFSFGMNYFLVPAGLFSSGILGVSQVIRSIVVTYIGIPVPAGVDLAGIINFMINVPLLFLAYKNISKEFFVKTVCSVILLTIFMTIIPVRSSVLIEEKLMNSIVAGVITGIGTGLLFRISSSSGGADILGFLLAARYKNFSIGKLTLILNTVLYLVCAALFNFETAVYSIAYTAVFSLIVDKIHIQNINTMALVFTKSHHTPAKIIQTMRRGVTQWDGKGAYTMDDLLIFATVISKYEVEKLTNIVYEEDDKAFIIFSEGTGVRGNFEKRL